MSAPTASATEALLDEMDAELERTLRSEQPPSSPAEGVVTIQWAVSDLRSTARDGRGTGTMARRQAVRVAATALRYALTLCQKAT